MKRQNINKCRKLRKNNTDAEKKLWNALRNRNLANIKFRRQYPALNYSLDFYSPDHCLCIEVDGGQHYSDDGKVADIERTKRLQELGIRILRFNNTEVLGNIEGVCRVILDAVGDPSPHQVSEGYAPASPRRGEEKNTIIIGAGPAGIAAAIQLRRAGVDFVIIEKNEIGGLLLNANLVENYPGVPAMSGVELVEKFKENLKTHNIEVVNDEALAVSNDGDTFTVKCTNNTYICSNVIMATGTKPKKISDDPNIIYEVYSIRNVQGKKITIIGGGDAAFDYALNLAKKNRVKIVFRSEQPKCLPLLYKRAKAHTNIEIIPNYGAVSEHMSADIVMAAIGREPNFINHSLENKNLSGLYYAGDIKNGEMRYVANAVADGIRVANVIAKGCHPREG